MHLKQLLLLSLIPARGFVRAMENQTNNDQGLPPTERLQTALGPVLCLIFLVSGLSLFILSKNSLVFDVVREKSCEKQTRFLFLKLRNARLWCHVLTNTSFAGLRLDRVPLIREDALGLYAEGIDPENTLESLCCSEVYMEDAVLVEASYMVVSEVSEYQQVQGLHVDSTVDAENDDFEEAPLSEVIVACPGVGECGVLGRVLLTAADAEHILRISRSSGKVIPHRGDVACADVDHCDFYFIHPLLFGLLMSVYPGPGELRRVLTQNWVRAWTGWTEASAKIESALTDHDENRIAE